MDWKAAPNSPGLNTEKFLTGSILSSRKSTTMGSWATYLAQKLRSKKRRVHYNRNPVVYVPSWLLMRQIKKS
jgi:hypothetical protein